MNAGRSLVVGLFSLLCVLGVEFDLRVCAEEIVVGDAVMVDQAAPLRSGSETLTTVAAGTRSHAIRLHGKYVLIEIVLEGNRVRGWVDQGHLSKSGDPPIAPVPVPTTNSANAAVPAATTFSAKQFTDIRQKVMEAARVPENVAEGWSISKVDPARLVPLFRTLKIKRGYVLRAYQFAEGGNGNGIVWAMPKDADFPDPNEALRETFGFPRPPKPNRALDNYMEAIEGDGSALSYISASILSRELQEFGALWHGCDWSLHTILDADPWAEASSDDEDPHVPSRPEAPWRWEGKRPTDWRPRLSVADGKIRVTFYTYSPLGKEGIYEHVDEFRPGEYRFTTSRKKVGVGPRELAL